MEKKKVRTDPGPTEDAAGKTPVYCSYLLRMWWDEDNLAWRIVLQEAVTGEKIGFSNLEDLLDFLRRRPGVAPGDSG